MHQPVELEQPHKLISGREFLRGKPRLPPAK